MRKLAAILLALTCLLGVASAQSLQTKAQISTSIASSFPDNTTGQITPAIVRTFLGNTNVSYQPYTGVNAQSGTTYTIALSDYGQLVTSSNASAVAWTLPLPSSFSPTQPAFSFYAKNIGLGTATITTTSATINGGSTYALLPGVNVLIVWDGANWQVWSGAGSGSGSNIDVFLLIGSSNTVGQGTSAQAPTPPSTALMYCNPSAGTPGITQLIDPVCSAVSTATNWNAQTGSLWPAFAISFNRPVVIVQTAVSGSTQASACDFLVGNGNWQATGGGSNYAASLTAINAAISALKVAGYNPIFRGILQQELGVNDGAQIDASVCTQAQYTAAFTAMAANYRAATIGGAVYPHLPIFMSLAPTNTNPAQPEIPGYKQIRDAQIAIIAADGNTLMPYVNTVSFGPRGLMQTNSVHPVQAGYNEWGYALGGAILPFVNKNIPFELLNANAAGPWLLPSTVGVLQLVQKDTFSTPLVMDTFAGSNGILMRSALGNGVTPTNITNGTILGTVGMKGYGATAFLATNQGGLQCGATQDFSDTVAGTQCNIFTTPNGAITPVRSIGLVNGSSAILGPVDAAAPTAQTLSVQNVVAGTSNTAGAAFVIAGSKGTGTGIGGSVQISVAPAGGSGNSQNSLTSFFTMLGNGNIGIGTETNPQFPFVVSANSTTGSNFGGISGLNGPIALGATGATSGWNAIAVASIPGNNFIRIDNTLASPNNLGSGELIGSINFGGWGSGSVQTGRSQIVVSTTEPWATTFGSSIGFNTTVVGGARAQSLLLKGGGVIVGTGTTDPLSGGLSLNGAHADYGYSFQTPATGFTITLGSTTWHTILDPAGTLATGTLTMPATPIDGMLVDVRSSQIVTALTVSPNAGQSIKGQPSSFAVGGILSCIYRAGNTTWYC